MDKARDLAARVLNEVHENGAYANVALVQALRQEKLSGIDRRFATELVYGATKAGETLDWILRRYVSRPLENIPPMVRDILRLGIYQIFCMDKVPPSAACNEAVELTKRYSHGGTAKFVNAVLRTAVRKPEKAKFPTGERNAAKRLALSAQHPEWLVKRWIADFGYEETERLCAFDNAPPPMSVRANALKTSQKDLLAKLLADGIAARPSAWAPEGILCASHGALDQWDALQQGLLQVQDESSMLAAHVLSPQPGEFVIDACSAPGGKATHAAALMNNAGRILACDVYRHKIRRVAENARRLGARIIEPKLLDARKLGKQYPGQADRVLVDAPCSGLGVLRRKPDARWRKEERLLPALSKFQGEILHGASGAVRPGGVLVYSTCTMTREENSAVVEGFLARHAEFALEDAGHFLPIQKREGKVIQLLPQRDGTDGFFIARMRRRA